jgi:hypothetical protein
MDDIGYIGNIDSKDGEGKQRAILRASIETEEGYEIMLSLDTYDEESYRQLYIPQLDRTFHAKFVGFSPDRTKYYRFSIQNVSLHDYLSKMKYDFVEGGWYQERSNIPEDA